MGLPSILSFSFGGEVPSLSVASGWDDSSCSEEDSLSEEAVEDLSSCDCCSAEGWSLGGSRSEGFGTLGVTPEGPG